MTFDEWLIDECGINNQWTFSEKEAAHRAWNAAKREALLEAADECAGWEFAEVCEREIRRMAEEIK